MAFFRGPNIVRDGLVLSLDANSTRSYPGSGTTWYDLTGNGDWTLPASNMLVNNHMKFQSQTMSKSPPTAWQGNVDCTIEAWWFPATSGIYTGCCVTIFGRYYFRFFQIGSSVYTMIGFDTGTNSYQHPNFTISYDVWHHVVGMRRNNSFIIWIDGVERYNTTFGSGYSLLNPTESWVMSSSRHSNLLIDVARIYNRGLSDTEVLQNYNVHKGRFGL